jgi:hypothetical protein
MECGAHAVAADSLRTKPKNTEDRRRTAAMDLPAGASSNRSQLVLVLYQ